MNKQEPEWIELQNKQWVEEDFTEHHISEYNPFFNIIQYTVSIKVPIIKKHFYHKIRCTPDELTKKSLELYSNIAKRHLLYLMFEELLNNKLKNE